MTQPPTDAHLTNRTGGMLNDLLASTTMGMALLSRDGTLLSVNASLCALLGRGEDALVGHAGGEFVHREDRAGLEAMLAGDTNAAQAETRFVRPDGAIAWTAANLTLLRDDDQAPICWVGQFQDITELHESREELRQQSRLLAGVIDNAPIGQAIAAADGRLLRVNRSLCRILGRSEDELLTVRFADIATPSTGIGERYVQQLIDGGLASYQIERRLLHASGKEVPVRMSVSLVRDQSGEPLHFIAQIEDITDQKLAEQQLRQREQVLADAQALARLGSWELDLDTGRLSWSDELCRISGVQPGTMPTYEEFIAMVHPDDRDDVARRIADARRQRFGDSEYRIVRPSGEIRHVHTRRFGRLNAHGELRAVWGTTLDITERVQAEAELRAAHDHAEAVLAAMGEGYALTSNGAILAVNERLCELTGFSRDELVGATMPYPFWPTDLLNQSRSLRDEIVGAGGGSFEMEVMRADGTRFPAEVTAKPARRADGSLLGFVNTMRDISARKAYEAEQEALRATAELVAGGTELRPVFEVVTRSIQAVFDAAGGAVARFIPETGQGEVLTSFTADGHVIEGRTFNLDGHTVAATVYRTRRPARIASGLSDEQMGDYYEQHQITGGAGTPISVNGQPWGALVVAFGPDRPVPHDATERLARFGHLITLALSNAETLGNLERHAHTDALTGLANQRAFKERLRREIDTAATDGSPLCLALFDLDHFKLVNDTHGHQVGDAVLAGVGRLATGLAREADTVARIGGEEFAWILPRTTAQEAHAITDRLRLTIAGHPFTGTGPLTISAGISMLEFPMTEGDLVAQADRALYQAKYAGRNAIRMAF